MGRERARNREREKREGGRRRYSRETEMLARGMEILERDGDTGESERVERKIDGDTCERRRCEQERRSYSREMKIRSRVRESSAREAEILGGEDAYDALSL